MKIKRIISILLIIIIFCTYTLSLAQPITESDVDDMLAGEQGNMPMDTPDGDETEVIIPDTPEEEVFTKTKMQVFDYIEGNAFEDLDTDRVYDSNEKYISNIIVQLLDTNGTVIDTKYTDLNGYYRFSDLEDGDYRLRFIYGLATNNMYLKGEDGTVKQEFKDLGLESLIYKTYNNDDIKNILKYNGQDYKAEVSGSNRLLSYTEETIIKKQKGASQVYLMIDCSNSMKKENENGISKLEIVKNSAKILAQKLLEDNSNIYIGVIGFGETAVNRQSLTNDITIIQNAISNVENIPLGTTYGVGTNIARAITEAENRFVNKNSDTSNRTVILLSDGAPTLYGTTKVYEEDTYQEKVDKLASIANDTNAKLINSQNNGVKIISLVPSTNNPLEEALINMTLVNVNDIYRPDNTDAISTVIKNEIKDKIIDQQQVSEDTSIGGNFNSHDDSSRRQIINSNYENINYSETEKFDLINTFNGSNTDKEKARELMQKTYMYAETTSSYKVVHVNGEDENNYYLSNGQALSKSSYELEYGGYTNQNLMLRQREPAELNVETKITGVKITLSNGSVFKEIVSNDVNGKSDINLGPYEKITNITSVANVAEDYLVEAVDEELIHGATVELEYTIIVRNEDTSNYKEFSLIDYIPNGMNMDPNAKLLTDDYTNKDYGWINVSKDELEVLNLISETQLQNMNGYMYPVTIINTEASDTDFPKALRKDKLTSNGERYIKVVFQAVVNANDENMNYENEVEILDYSNSEGRRMGEFNSSSNSISYVQPGNGWEFDHSNQAKVIIVPPFGKWHYCIWGVTILLIIASFTIRLKLNKRK